MSIWVPFCLVFGSNLTSKIDQKSTKIDVKLHLIWDIVFGFVLGVILVPTWAQPDLKIVDFSLCFVYFLKNDLCKLASISSLIWVPTWLHFRPQNRPKSAPTWVPRAIQILNDFWIVFYSFLVAFMVPKCSHAGPKLAPNLATEPPPSGP